MLKHELHLLEKCFNVLDIVKALDFAKIYAEIGLKAAPLRRFSTLFKLLRIICALELTTSRTGSLRRCGAR